MNYSINKGEQVCGSEIPKKKMHMLLCIMRSLGTYICTLAKIQYTKYMSTHTSLKSKKSQNCPIDAQIYVHLYFFMPITCVPLWTGKSN